MTAYVTMNLLAFQVPQYFGMLFPPGGDNYEFWMQDLQTPWVVSLGELAV